MGVNGNKGFCGVNCFLLICFLVYNILLICVN